MTGSSTNGTSKDVSENNHSPAKDEMAQVNHLLFEPEQTQIREVQERLENHKLSAEELSQLVAEAIAKRPIPDEELTTALLPTVENVIYASVRKDANIIANAIFPALGSSIRKAVAAAINEMTQALNQTLEYGFSNQSLQWRLEALYTGKSFAEIVLLHTLLYRVEQVFLIHKETGLVLQHVVAPAVAAQDADLVSAMLTAIQDFVRDSFSVEKGDSLNALQFGELTLWIEQGPQAILAGVIRGNAPQKLRLVFQDALARIHLEQSSALESFNGDTAPFAATAEVLETCLDAQYEIKKQKPSPLVWIVSGAMGVGLLTWIGLSIQGTLRWTSFLEKLNNEPGIVITRVEKHGDKYLVWGLRDPMAADPTALMQAAKVHPKTVITQWEPYISLHPVPLTGRIKQLLQPPQTVSLRVDKNGILYATGSAPYQWIVETRKRIQVIPGITQFREENLINADLKQLESHREHIEKQIIRFEEGTTQLVPGQDNTLAKLSQEIEKVLDSALSLNKDVRVKLVGRTDERGSVETNMSLSQDRSDEILSRLVSKRVNPSNFEAVGVGSTEPLRNGLGIQESAINRSVSFKVIITDKPNSSTLQR
ncbi:MAG: OmpA family protein [Coleofasciculus sp. Co-bin14]|nr:OmpA family protein [Coleofasciculus sp. Co-bin14]